MRPHLFSQAAKISHPATSTWHLIRNYKCWGWGVLISKHDWLSWCRIIISGSKLFGIIHGSAICHNHLNQRYIIVSSRQAILLLSNSVSEFSISLKGSMIPHFSHSQFSWQPQQYVSWTWNMCIAYYDRRGILPLAPVYKITQLEFRVQKATSVYISQWRHSIAHCSSLSWGKTKVQQYLHFPVIGQHDGIYGAPVM